jgi:hypothetical protein
LGKKRYPINNDNNFWRSKQWGLRRFIKSSVAIFYKYFSVCPQKGTFPEHLIGNKVATKFKGGATMKEKKKHLFEEKHDRRSFLKNLGKVTLPAIAILGFGATSREQIPDSKQSSGGEQIQDGKTLHGKQKFSSRESNQSMSCDGTCSGSCQGVCNGHYV